MLYATIDLHRLGGAMLLSGVDCNEFQAVGVVSPLVWETVLFLLTFAGSLGWLITGWER